MAGEQWHLQVEIHLTLRWRRLPHSLLLPYVKILSYACILSSSLPLLPMVLTGPLLEGRLSLPLLCLALGRFAILRNKALQATQRAIATKAFEVDVSVGFGGANTDGGVTHLM